MNTKPHTIDSGTYLVDEVPYQYEVRIDLDRFLATYISRAAASASGKASLAYGMIQVMVTAKVEAVNTSASPPPER